jgi:arylsulfatase A-like enzyme
MNKNLLPLICLLSPVITSCNLSHNKDDNKGIKPNVILFLIDDFGYGDISFEGNTQIQTPNIDRIARGGASFTRFYQSAGASAPTRASLLTGRYHLETGVWDVHDGRDFIRKDETTIADVLKKEGYATGAFGKWHSGKTYSYFSWSRGFDTGIHPVLYNFLDSRLIFNNKIVNTDGPVEDVLGTEVVKFIEKNKDKPFFAYIPVQSVHEPFNCPADLFEKYKAKGYSDHVARLYGMIELFDNNIGKVLDAVEKNGLDEKTIIMFMSDDGPAPGFDLSFSNRRMNESEQAERSRAWKTLHRGGKASIYEGGEITPFYIMWKNMIPEGKTFNELSGIIDVFPTILEACNIKVPENSLPLAGKSLWPLLTGKKIRDWDNRYYFDNTNFYLIPRGKINIGHPRVRQISVHHKNYKLIRFDRFHSGKDSVYCELYDLEKDPLEKNNIASEYHDLTSTLRKEAENWFESILNSGRAYGQAVFEPGKWEERGSPINPDAYVEYYAPDTIIEKTSFAIDNLNEPGSFVSYNINVTEPGSYRVEIGYIGKSVYPGNEFMVYTKYDTASLKISGKNSSVSEILSLPEGNQLLTLKRVGKGTGKTEPEKINSIIIHRIPEKQDSMVIRNPGIRISQGKEETGTFYLLNDVSDFMYRGRKQDSLFHLRRNESISIEPFADNPEQIESVAYFNDFDLIKEDTVPPFNLDLQSIPEKKFTLNVEFKSKTGVKNSVRAYLVAD